MSDRLLVAAALLAAAADAICYYSHFYNTSVVGGNVVAATPGCPNPDGTNDKCTLVKGTAMQLGDCENACCGLTGCIGYMLDPPQMMCIFKTLVGASSIDQSATGFHIGINPTLAAANAVSLIPYGEAATCIYDVVPQTDFVAGNLPPEVAGCPDPNPSMLACTKIGPGLTADDCKTECCNLPACGGYTYFNNGGGAICVFKNLKGWNGALVPNPTSVSGVNRRLALANNIDLTGFVAPSATPSPSQSPSITASSSPTSSATPSSTASPSTIPLGPCGSGFNPNQYVLSTSSPSVDINGYLASGQALVAVQADTIRIQRIETAAVNDDATINIAEVKAFENWSRSGETAAQSSLTSATVTATTSFGGMYPVTNVIDSVLNSFYHSAGYDTTITIALGTTHYVNTVKVYPRQDCCFDRMGNVTITLVNGGVDVATWRWPYGTFTQEPRYAYASAYCIGSPSASNSPAPSPSSTPSVTASASPSASVTPSSSVSPSGSATPSASSFSSTSPTPSASTSPSASASPSASTSPSASASPSSSASSTGSASASASPTESMTVAPSKPIEPPSESATSSSTPSGSVTPSVTPSSSVSPSHAVSPSVTATPSRTASPSAPSPGIPVARQIGLLLAASTPSPFPTSTPSSSPNQRFVSPLLVNDFGMLPATGIYLNVSITGVQFVNPHCSALRPVDSASSTGLAIAEGATTPASLLLSAFVHGALVLKGSEDNSAGLGVAYDASAGATTWLWGLFHDLASTVTCVASPSLGLQLSAAKLSDGGMYTDERLSGMRYRWAINVTSALSPNASAAALTDFFSTSHISCTGALPQILVGSAAGSNAQLPLRAGMPVTSTATFTTSAVPVVVHRASAPIPTKDLLLTDASAALAVLTACNVSSLTEAATTQPATSDCSATVLATRIAAAAHHLSLSSSAVTIVEGSYVSLAAYGGEFPSAQTLAAIAPGAALVVAVGNVTVDAVSSSVGAMITFAVPAYDAICVAPASAGTQTGALQRSSFVCPQPKISVELRMPSSATDATLSVLCDAVAPQATTTTTTSTTSTSTQTNPRGLQAIVGVRRGGGFSCPPFCGADPATDATAIEYVTPTALVAASTSSVTSGGIVYTRPCPVPDGFTRGSFAECTNSSQRDSYTLCYYGEPPYCVACPTGGVCPGGNRLWSATGYFVLSEDSLDLPFACLAPATKRCTGWDASSGTTACGVGYEQGSYACSKCASGYYADDELQGACTACPASSSSSEVLTGIASILGGVLGVLAFFAIIVVVTVKQRGGTIKGGVKRIVAFSIAIFTSIQTVISIVRNAPAQATPSVVATIFAAVRKLQFEGVSPVPLACTSSSSLLVPSIVMCVAMAAASIWMLAALLWWAQLPAHAASYGCCRRVQVVAHRIARFKLHWLQLISGRSATLCALMFGIVCNKVFDTLVCDAADRTLLQYINLTQDGTAARNAGLSMTSTADLQKTMRVQLLRSNPDIVCFEGDHVWAYNIALATAAVVLAAFPLTTAVFMRFSAIPSLLAANNVPEELLKRFMPHIAVGGAALQTTLAELAGDTQGKAAVAHKIAAVAAQRPGLEAIAMLFRRGAAAGRPAIAVSDTSEWQLYKDALAAEPKESCCGNTRGAGASSADKSPSKAAPGPGDQQGIMNPMALAPGARSRPSPSRQAAMGGNGSGVSPAFRNPALIPQVVIPSVQPEAVAVGSSRRLQTTPSRDGAVEVSPPALPRVPSARLMNAKTSGASPSPSFKSPHALARTPSQVMRSVSSFRLDVNTPDASSSPAPGLARHPSRGELLPSPGSRRALPHGSARNLTLAGGSSSRSLTKSPSGPDVTRGAGAPPLLAAVEVAPATDAGSAPGLHRSGSGGSLPRQGSSPALVRVASLQRMTVVDRLVNEQIMLADGTTLRVQVSANAPKDSWQWERVRHVWLPVCGCNCCFTRRHSLARKRASDTIDSALSLNPGIVRSSCKGFAPALPCYPAAYFLDCQYRVSHLLFVHLNWALLVLTTAFSSLVTTTTADDGQLLARSVVLPVAYITAASAILSLQPFRPGKIFIQPVSVYSLVLSGLATIHFSAGSMHDAVAIEVASYISYLVAALCIGLLPFIMTSFLLTMFVGATGEKQTRVRTSTAAGTAAKQEWQRVAEALPSLPNGAAAGVALAQEGGADDKSTQLLLEAAATAAATRPDLQLLALPDFASLKAPTGSRRHLRMHLSGYAAGDAKAMVRGGMRRPTHVNLDGSQRTLGLGPQVASGERSIAPLAAAVTSRRIAGPRTAISPADGDDDDDDGSETGTATASRLVRKGERAQFAAVTRARRLETHNRRR